MKTSMRTGLIVATSAALLALGAAGAAHGQELRIPAEIGAVTSPPMLMVSSGRASTEIGSEIVREIDDPHIGTRWLLIRDREHPGGPGRMVMASGSPERDSSSKNAPSLPAVMKSLPAKEPGWASFRPIIRAGDHLIIEEHTKIAESYLEAVALGPAEAGSELSVRLKLGGKTVRAMALAPGRVAFEPETGGRP